MLPSSLGSTTTTRAFPPRDETMEAVGIRLWILANSTKLGSCSTKSQKRVLRDLSKGPTLRTST